MSAYEREGAENEMQGNRNIGQTLQLIEGIAINFFVFVII